MAAKKPKPGSGQIQQLRATILALRAKLEQEARQRKLHMGLAKASKDARAKIAQQAEGLKKRGESLAKQLREVIAAGEKERRRCATRRSRKWRSFARSSRSRLRN